MLAPRDDVSPLFEDGLYRLGRGRYFVQSRPAHGVVPGSGDGLVTVVHRSRGGVLALEGVPGVEAPQPTVARDPVGDGMVEEPWLVPHPVSPLPDAQAVPPSVVHEGDAEVARPVALLAVLHV